MGQQLERLHERVLEPAQVRLHVLLVQVHRLERVPSLLVDGAGVLEHRVIPGVLIAQARLVKLDHVLEVVDLHVRRRLPERATGEPLQPAVGHHLDEHGAGGEEHHVGEPVAVHPHHHVGRVHQPRELGHVRAHVRVADAHVEPQAHGHVHHGALVQEPARGPARDDQKPGPAPDVPPVAAGRGCRAFQPERAAEHGAEINHGCSGWRSGRVHAELLVEGRPDHHVRVAPDFFVGVDVDDLVPAQLLEDLQVLAGPPGLEAAHKELHLPGVAARRDERRDEHVRVVMEQVAREPTGGEHERGGRAVDRAGWWRRAAGEEGTERPLLDVGQRERVVLPAVGLHLPLLLQRGDVDGLDAPLHADVAGGLASVRAAARLVAHPLAAQPEMVVGGGKCGAAYATDAAPIAAA
ncbi:unnamed protein product [Urochloa decumbens]|uniref:Uncharacterized protein n=1 Tax=Urochloa decumbens TaxID=240449 RepID=A0ABC9EMV5_9POAL